MKLLALLCLLVSYTAFPRSNDEVKCHEIKTTDSESLKILIRRQCRIEKIYVDSLPDSDSKKNRLDFIKNTLESHPMDLNYEVDYALQQNLELSTENAKKIDENKTLNEEIDKKLKILDETHNTLMAQLRKENDINKEKIALLFDDVARFNSEIADAQEKITKNQEDIAAIAKKISDNQLIVNQMLSQSVQERQKEFEQIKEDVKNGYENIKNLMDSKIGMVCDTKCSCNTDVGEQ